MDKLQEFLKEQFREDLILAVLSGQRDKAADAPSRVRIRQIRLKDGICFQAAALVGTKEFHTNLRRGEVISYVADWLGKGFSQLQVQGRYMDGTVLVSKKGKFTIKTKYHGEKTPVRIQSHDRVKQYILKEGVPVPFLVDLGVMSREGYVRKPAADKFRQINRFLEFIEDVLWELPEERRISVVDFGCGKSYLTFAMYYYLHELKGRDVNIAGLDLKEDVIKKCAALAEKYGYKNLHFYQGDIAHYEEDAPVDMVVTLHACDTATDYALAKAVNWNARVILSVPCCQHELNKQIQNDLLEPVLGYGILKERISALLTDGIRAELLKTRGYAVQILEFIDMENTPKNLLIRAVKKGGSGSPAALGELTGALGADLTLMRLLGQPELP